MNFQGPKSRPTPCAPNSGIFGEELGLRVGGSLAKNMSVRNWDLVREGLGLCSFGKEALRLLGPLGPQNPKPYRLAFEEERWMSSWLVRTVGAVYMLGASSLHIS